MRFVRIRRRTALLSVAALAAGVAVPTAFAASGKGQKAAIYLVGGGVTSINPTAAMLKDNFNLGGYGFGSGKVANEVGVHGVTDLFAGRLGDGILGDGAHSRALAVSDGKATIVLAQIETQGYFDAYKQGPFGLNEIRQDAAAKIGDLAGKSDAPAPTAQQILLDSNHSHGGPDTAGVWGGVPTSYLKLVHDRTVTAIVKSWRTMRRATLTYGIAHAGVAGERQYPPQECIDAGHRDCQGVANPDWLLHNQFASDPANLDMDDEIRVLQARDPGSGRVLDTYVNYASHPTVLGPDNTKVTGDYVGRLNLAIQKAFGGFGMDQVGTLGREQPERAGCDKPSIKPADKDKADATPAYALCELDQYASRILVKVKDAVRSGTTLTGKPIVAMNSYLLSDTTTSGILAGVTYAGAAIGVPAGRSGNPPWYTGSQLGTSYFVGRIGPALITGGPGEMYAQIWQKVKDTVTADKKSGITSVMNIGTAGDFLGYIIAPLEAYPEPMRASMFDGDAPPKGGNCSGVPSPVGCPSPIDNDNYFFNISHTFGERLTCDFLRGADDVLQRGTKYWSSYDRCNAFVNDHVAPAGLDTQFPQQPDLSSVLTHM